MKINIKTNLLSIVLITLLISTSAAQSSHNLPPKFVEEPDSLLSGSHCDILTTTVKAKSRVFFPDPDFGAIRYKMISGPGEVDAKTGAWTYLPSIEESGDTQTVVIAAVQGELITVGSDACEFDVFAENNPPYIGFHYNDCGEAYSVAVPGLFSNRSDIHDWDRCDAVEYFVESVPPLHSGSASMTSHNTNIQFEAEDADKEFHFTLTATDGKDTSRCEFFINTYLDSVIIDPPEKFEIEIEKTHGTFQGGHELVDITVNKGTEDMLGFDLLIAYDASALSFQTATEGSVYDECEWEYFTYRYGAPGECDNCPNGLIRFVGLAETNNGPNHPTCYGSAPFTLLSIDFLVTDDRTYECVYVPIRFFWNDCIDNQIYYKESGNNPITYHGLSDSVFDFEGYPITFHDNEFPTYFGAPNIPCLAGGDQTLNRYVDFINGGVDIACADSIDGRGDLNLNGISNEIADAVLYINYFVYGIGVFTNYQAQVAASDVNYDNLTLTVSDLMYQINIIRGEIPSNNEMQGLDTALVYIENNILSILGIEMGGAYIVLEGNTAPELLYGQMDIKYNYDVDNDVTRVLIYSFNGTTFSGGDLINLNGNLQSIEMATSTSRRVLVQLISPTQNITTPINYPNPFNNETVISFDIPKAQNIQFEIYNTLGQKIYDLRKYYDAGQVHIGWDGTNSDGQNIASGIYFYKIITDQDIFTSKMVLIK